MSSSIKTLLLFTILSSILIFVGYLLAGTSGLIVFLIISLFLNLGSYWFSDKIALSMSGAKEVSKNQYGEIFQDLEELTTKMNIPMPRLYLTPDLNPNAFATGRNKNNSAVALTQGIINKLSREELKGVLAHELAHIKNNDILLSTVAVILASSISNIANIALFFGGNNDEDSNPLVILLLAILTPIVATIIQFAISRTREFKADATAAKYTGNPRALADALLSISRESTPTNNKDMLASLYIYNPLSGVGNLFSTHPPVNDRVERLLSLSILA